MLVMADLLGIPPPCLIPPCLLRVQSLDLPYYDGPKANQGVGAMLGGTWVGLIQEGIGDVVSRDQTTSILGPYSY